MPRFENPTVLVTRPLESSDRFVAELRALAGCFQPLISPAFELVGTGVTVPEFGAAVFTSQAGVAFAPKGEGRTAYCVGHATALAAQHAGYVPVNSKGDVSDLVGLILRRAPPEMLLHIRGETSVGDVTQKLVDDGLRCQEAATYRKSPLKPDPAAREVLIKSNTTVIPLFSAETVSILAGWNINLERGHIIAMSPAVATSALQLSSASITTATDPNQAAMVAATARLIA